MILLDSIKNNTIFAASKSKDQFVMNTKKVREVIKMLKADGWYLAYTKGDHRQFKHPTKKGKVTVNKKLSDDLDGDLLDNILKQSGLK